MRRRTPEGVRTDMTEEQRQLEQLRLEAQRAMLSYLAAVSRTITPGKMISGVNVIVLNGAGGYVLGCELATIYTEDCGNSFDRRYR